jgi:hypothetical protein
MQEDLLADLQEEHVTWLEPALNCELSVLYRINERDSVLPWALGEASD